ncbi:MAG: MBL fold metallo-hydrolase [Burkholderiales bacterium]|nr:MBL fold metallo-hydrolase [Burkholderiales bacterium]
MRPSLLPELINDPFGDPGVYVDCLFEGRALLIDLGDLRPLAPRKLLRVSDIFVSHCHMDHFMGFDWFLRICLGRDRSVRMYGPPDFIDRVEAKLAAYAWNLVHRYDNDFQLTVHALQPDGCIERARFHVRTAFRREPLAPQSCPDGVVLREPGLCVRAVLLDHGIPCLGYALEEALHVNVWKNRLAERGLPVGPWLRALKHAVLRAAPADTPIPTPLGERPLAELMDCVQLTTGLRIAYVTDVAYHADNARRIIDLARDADWLFIEAVFLDEAAARAAEKRHLTAAQAGRLARAARAKTVVPFHFSPIYRGRESELYAELQAELDGVQVCARNARSS